MTDLPVDWSLGFGPTAPEITGMEANSAYSSSSSGCTSGSGTQSSTSSSISYVDASGLSQQKKDTTAQQTQMTDLFAELDETFFTSAPCPTLHQGSDSVDDENQLEKRASGIVSVRRANVSGDDRGSRDRIERVLSSGKCMSKEL